MKIDLHSTIQNIPLREIKRIFKKSEYIDVGFLERELNIDIDHANKLIAELAKGFLEKDELNPNTFRTTHAGKRLAASSTQRISKLKAWQLFDSFIERVEHVNSKESEYAFRVNRVVLTGSFFVNQEQSDFGDIDLFIRLKPRYNDIEKQNDLKMSRIMATKKRFATVLDQMNWPRTEVIKFLKNRSRYLSINDDYDSHMNLDPKRYEVIYESSFFPANEI